MNLLSLEHGKTAYAADFVLYGTVVAALAVSVIVGTPRHHWPATVACVLLGLAAWTFAEYLLHRFVLHGLQPFRRWHAQHHARPRALIGTPTLISVALFGLLVVLPALLLGTLWQAGALILGVTSGYLVYAVTHHALHHWPARNPWLARRKRWHALHHHAPRPGCYGVTTSLWDHVFRSHHRPAPPFDR